MFEYQKVKLIAYTQPVNDLIHGAYATPTAQDLISYCARVSNPNNQANLETSEKLLNYCIRKKHWSIFEMSNVVLEIETTRDIARQILRHRSFHFQEFSQRYADPTKDLGLIYTREARLQDNKNRQNSIETDDNDVAETWSDLQKAAVVTAINSYNKAIEMGVAKEQARSILPEGLTISRMYMNGTVRDWIHYCQLRMGPETQKEHRDIANKCWKELNKVFPFLSTLEND